MRICLRQDPETVSAILQEQERRKEFIFGNLTRLDVDKEVTMSARALNSIVHPDPFTPLKLAINQLKPRGK